MNANLQAKATAYLRDVLGADAAFSLFPEAEALPVHIAQAYQIDRCDLLGRTFLFLLPRDADLSTMSMEKHAQWLHQKTGLRSLFVIEALSSYDRKRLIGSKIPFLVPGYQLYLPDLGLDLREQFNVVRKALEKLCMPGQVVVLACLLRRIDPRAEFTGAGLAEQFGYTKMTMTRAPTGTRL